MNLTKSLAAVGLGIVCAVVCAQQPASAAGTGTVTGHVTCGDTQRPARLAGVALLGIPKETTQIPKLDSNADPEAMLAAMKSAMQSMSKSTMVNSQTDMNGAFVVENVPPGDYYVFSTKAGYISPINEIRAMAQAGVDVHKQLPGVPVVHVTAEHAANIEVSIDRGASISGAVQFDDGTPVTGAMVTVIPAKGDENQVPTEFAMLGAAGGGSLIGLVAPTDDLGHFRSSGLASGDYLVQVSLPLKSAFNITGGSFNLSRMLAVKLLVAFAPATFHKSEAKAITLSSGEDKRDVAVTFNLNGMHTVSGRIASKEDHHGINSGTVTVADANDKEFVRSASVDAAGNFTITYVPAGTYELKVSRADDTVPPKRDEKNKDDDDSPFNFADDKAVKSYDDATQSLVVTDSDITGLNLELTPSKTVRKSLDLGGIVGGIAK